MCLDFFQGDLELASALDYPPFKVGVRANV
jgi:hypothetical protein